MVKILTHIASLVGKFPAATCLVSWYPLLWLPEDLWPLDPLLPFFCSCSLFFPFPMIFFAKFSLNYRNALVRWVDDDKQSDSSDAGISPDGTL